MSFLLLTFVIVRCVYSICTWSFRMLNVEMPKETTPKEALVAIQDRIQRDKRTREAQKSTTPPRHSSRLGSGYTSSSPSHKDSSPAAKKSKKAATKKSLKVLDSESEGDGKEGETNDDETPEAEAEKPPDYKDRVVSYTNSQNRPALGNVGEYSREEKAYEVTFTYSDDLEPKEHVDYCPQHWVEKYLVDSGTAAAWTEAVEAALDGSKTSRKTKNPQLPDGEKRKRISTTLYKPHENTPNAKRTRGKKKKDIGG